MKTVKIVLIILLAAFIILQFFPKDLPDNSPAGESDLITSGKLPDEVAEIVRNSCYDCHSNQVNYPWYSHIAPTAWLVGKDVREGRTELNFSEWGDYSLRNMIGRLDAMQKEVSSGTMPLPVYTLMHPNAKLNEEQASMIVQWTEDFAERMLE